MTGWRPRCPAARRIAWPGPTATRTGGASVGGRWCGLRHGISLHLDRRRRVRQRLSSGSPPSFISVPQEDRDGVGEEHDDQQHDDGGRRQLAELVLRLLAPTGRWSAATRCSAQERVDGRLALGVEKPPTIAPDEEQRRGLAERPGEREDRAGEDARDGRRQRRACGSPPSVTPDAVARLADRDRDGAQRLGGGDDHDRQDQDGQRQAAASRWRPSREPPSPMARRRRRRSRARAGRRRRRDAGEVADVDLDEPRQPVVRRVLLEVDGGRDADRERDDGTRTISRSTRTGPGRSRPVPGRTTGRGQEVEPARSGRPATLGQTSSSSDDEHGQGEQERRAGAAGRSCPRTSGRVDARPRRTAAPVAAGAIRLIAAS